MKLGGQFQRKDTEVKSSTLAGRDIFLSLVALMTPEVVLDLMKPCNLESISDYESQDRDGKEWWIRFFLLHMKSSEWFAKDVEPLGCRADVRYTSVLAYFDFHHQNKDEFDRIKRDKEKELAPYLNHRDYDLFVYQRTLDEFIPSWTVLQSKPNSKWLCEELEKWAKKWNLTEDWCLDFGLRCLGYLKGDFIDKFHPDANYLERVDPNAVWRFRGYWKGQSWHSILLERRLETIYRNYASDSGIPVDLQTHLTFSYSWPQSLCAEETEGFLFHQFYNPFVSGEQEFIREVEELFWKHFFYYFESRWTFLVGRSGQIADGIKAFDELIKAFFRKVNRIIEPIAEKTVFKENDSHFRWLIEYQVNKRSQSSIAKTMNVTRRAVEEGLEDVCNIIGLQLRPPSKGGRPRGARTRERGAGRVAFRTKPAS
jgi:hypothetical protein